MEARRERASGLLEQELQADMRPLTWVLGTEFDFSGRAMRALNTVHPQPFSFIQLSHYSFK